MMSQICFSPLLSAIRFSPGLVSSQRRFHRGHVLIRGFLQHQSWHGSSFYVPESGRALCFQPPLLQFGTQPLGLPRAETIYINNPSQDQPVTLLSMFTSSRHFHIPAFHRKVIPPRGKASFKLIFLPTEEGSVENTLFINTSSHGVLSYQVFGVGVHHGSYKDLHKKHSLLIFPHIQSIKLTQTQDEASNITILGLQLECSLPKEGFGHPQGSCFLSEERLAVRISLAERGDKHTGLERFKPYVIENIMVLFEIPSAGSGLWEPRMNIYMLNSGVKKLYVKEIQLLSKAESSVEFQQAPLSPSAANFTQVASLACRGSLLDRGKECSSHVSMHVLNGYTLKTYPAFNITHRRFGNDSATLFHVKQRQNRGDHADLWLTNGFDFSFSVNDVTVSPDMDGLLKVVNFSRAVTVPPGCWKLFSLRFINRKEPMNMVTTLVLLTSVGLSLEIPLHIHSSVSKQGDVVFEASGECGSPCQLRLSDTGRAQWQQSLGSHGEDGGSCWRVDSSLASELYSHWRSRRDQLSCIWPRLPAGNGSPLDFGATPVNESKLKYFTLKNPSASPISVELLALSSYSAPLEALDLLTKWFKMNPLSVNVTTAEFTLQNSESQAGRTLKGSGAVRLHLRPWESREIGVLFTPAEHKPVTSIILLRNNLTVFDMVVVKGHGAREMLRVGGKLPGTGASLRFNVPQSTLMECRDGLKTTKPLFAIRKSFKVENAGELPLTVMSMNINGYKCQGYGFEVLECRSFQLDYNSSSEINIAFTPDFTSSWVIRDLTLVTGRGSTFPFTLNVTLPHHMLPLCAQVVPGPSWEESFWLVTLIFTCLSLSGVCLMAFRQAQYILADFTTPSPRANHNSTLSRGSSAVDTISPNAVNKMKGSCKTFVDTCNTSDKGKGKGSPAVSSSASRGQSSVKKSSGAPAQPQKKHKVSVYYGKYKVNPASTTAAASAEEEREDVCSDQAPEQDPVACSDGSSPDTADCPAATDKKSPFTENCPAAKEDLELAPVMFPMETHSDLSEDVPAVLSGGPGPFACAPAEKVTDEGGPRAWPCSPLSHLTDRKLPEKREVQGSEPREECNIERKLLDRIEQANSAGNKGKKSANRSRRRPEDSVTGVPEHSVVILSEKNKELEWRESRNPNRSRNRFSNGKLDTPKPGPHPDSSHTQHQNGVCAARPRRKGEARRPQWESGSDSGSSSGSVRASRGSWGSWSSASSLEGEKDPSGRPLCTTSASTQRSVQHSVYPSERDLPLTCNRAQSMQNLCQRDPCQIPDPAPTPGFTPSFATVAAGAERTLGMACPFLSEEAWSAPSLPLSSDPRLSAAQSHPLLPPGSPSAVYHNFPWSSANSQCTSSYPYCDQSNYMLGGNADFQNGFPCHESQGVCYRPPSHWREERGQGVPPAWGSPSSVGTKPYFGTRSLSPMSSLFGSIWTPQSEPYQSHFQPDRPVPPSPQAPFSREPGGSCRQKQYSTFNPFGPHMNLDIWNSSSSSSNRSSNSQLSSDSGYYGDV
ncbi:transmembrane protein 131-like isoform X2 [Megalops cyprinoides]|uniref:transmembrane protein 131-like isoform X2 n=1 Tax=Megalops cyprinoides TaxID=118141 RepID=UPI001863E94D|nr:transmembrane protein 131-like isoform X2 [Megalops cyprinoides]